MKRTTIALAALVVITSLNATAEQRSPVFNDAINNWHNLQEQDRQNLAHYNDTDSRDGTGRFNPDGSFNNQLATDSDKTHAALRAAKQKVNGTTYRDQIGQQQADARAAALQGTALTPAGTVGVKTPAQSVPVGVKTPVQSVPSVIRNKPVVPSTVHFVTAQGNGGNNNQSRSSYGGSENRGADNAHSSAFGGHGYGHDNSRSEGFGGHAHFH